MVLWGLPGTLLACLLGYVVYLLVRAGDGPLGPFSAQRAGISLAIVPAMVTLVGLLIAVGSTSGATLARWLRRVAVLVFVVVAVLGAHRLVAHTSANTALGTVSTGGPNFTVVMSKLSPNWVRLYGLSALAGAAPVLAALWSAWLIRASAGAGLMPRSRRVMPTALAAAATVLVAFALPELIEWIGRKTIPALGPGGNALPPSMLGRGGQPPPALPIPWHAQWVNPDSALLVAVIGYVLVMLLGVWLWMGMLRLRERTRLLAGGNQTTHAITSAS